MRVGNTARTAGRRRLLVALLGLVVLAVALPASLHRVSLAAAQAEPMRPFPELRITGRFEGDSTTFSRVTVKAPRDATIDARCLGKGCPFDRLALPAARGRQPALERRFGVGARLEVRVGSPDRVGAYTGITIRPSLAPTRQDRCLPPGSDRPAPCSTEAASEPLVTLREGAIGAAILLAALLGLLVTRVAGGIARRRKAAPAERRLAGARPASRAPEPATIAQPEPPTEPPRVAEPVASGAEATEPAPRPTPEPFAPAARQKTGSTARKPRAPAGPKRQRAVAAPRTAPPRPGPDSDGAATPQPPKPARKAPRKPAAAPGAKPAGTRAVPTPSGRPREEKPASRDPGFEWCAILSSRTDRTGRFHIAVIGKGGKRRAVADSPAFRVPRSGPIPDRRETRAAHDQLVGQLMATGWQPVESPGAWHDVGFARHRTPARARVRRCAITVLSDGSQARFRANELDDYGNAKPVAESSWFPAARGRPLAATAEARQAHGALLVRLRSEGWTPRGTAPEDTWYATELERPRGRQGSRAQGQAASGASRQTGRGRPQS
jgi:hypothetical protein